MHEEIGSTSIEASLNNTTLLNVDDIGTNTTVSFLMGIENTTQLISPLVLVIGFAVGILACVPKIIMYLKKDEAFNISPRPFYRNMI